MGFLFGRAAGIFGEGKMRGRKLKMNALNQQNTSESHETCCRSWRRMR